MVTTILGQDYPQITLGPQESVEVRRRYDPVTGLCLSQVVVLIRPDGTETVIEPLIPDAPSPALPPTKRHRRRRRA